MPTVRIQSRRLLDIVDRVTYPDGAEIVRCSHCTKTVPDAMWFPLSVNGIDARYGIAFCLECLDGFAAVIRRERGRS
jgi:LSD1 subclass zinc finger protein